MADQSNTPTTPGTNAPSKQAVGGVSSTTVKDDPKTGTDGPSAPPVNTNDTGAPAQTISDAELDKARAHGASTLDPLTQKEIDEKMGNSPEVTSDAKVSDMKHVTKHSEEMKSNPGLIKRLENFVESEGSPLKIISDIVSLIPSDTPDDYTLGGHAGKKLKLGHLRALIAQVF
jgi:hypothetical protein